MSTFFHKYIVLLIGFCRGHNILLSVITRSWSDRRGSGLHLLTNQKTTRQAHNKYLYGIISPKLKDNKQFYSYIKSKKQDASGISSLRDNKGYLHSEAKEIVEILNAQFKSVF
jgi:hypothetical protein